MTDEPLPEQISISCEINGVMKYRIFGKDGSDIGRYEEGKEIYSDLCIEELRECVPPHWYGMIICGYTNKSKDDIHFFKNEIIDLEYQFNFIRKMLIMGINIWYVKTWVDDVVKKEDMVVKDIDVSDLHFLDESKRPDEFTFEWNVFYRFVMK